MQKTDIETATVISTDGKLAVVRTNKSKACRECGKAQAGICGKKGTGMVFEVTNHLGAIPGDIVAIDIERNVSVRGYFVFFILPVISLILSSIAGSLLSKLTSINGLDAAAGVAGLILSIIYSLRKLKKMNNSVKLEIRKILENPNEQEDGCSTLQYN